MNTTLHSRVGKYSVIEELGRGASAMSFRVWDEFGNRDVAINVFDARVFAEITPGYDDLARDGLFVESALFSKLNHPYVMSVFDACIGPVPVFCKPLRCRKKLVPGLNPRRQNCGPMEVLIRKHEDWCGVRSDLPPRGSPVLDFATIMRVGVLLGFANILRGKMMQICQC